MPYSRNFELSEIRRGRRIRRTPVHDDEYFEVGDFRPEIGGWELRPNGRDIYRWQGILLYLKPESIQGGFELFLDD
jgi:hypothetical protein